MKELAENELVELIKSWENLALVVKHIGNYPEHLGALMKLVFDDSNPRNWRAAWMVDKIHEQHPDLIIPYLPAMTDFVLTTKNEGKKRHLLKLISLHEIPEDQMAVMLNYCIDVFTSPTEPIAVRAHAMQVLFNIAQKEPDFAGELIELIQNEMELHGSAGIAARGRQLIKKLIRVTHTDHT
ncbi:MAG: hypothetical protein H7X84_06500 [Verrucomicrobia bacterium]|nr:hypothetical protein [Prolixibacteraceae bacterium]